MVSNSFLSPLTKLETTELSWFCSAWPMKFDDKLVWSRFLPTVTHTRFLHRTIVIRFFFVPERFQTHFFNFYNIRNNRVVPILFRLTQESWWQTRTVTVSSYCDSHSLFASDDCKSDFVVPEWFQTHFFPLLQNWKQRNCPDSVPLDPRKLMTNSFSHGFFLLWLILDFRIIR